MRLQFLKKVVKVELSAPFLKVICCSLTLTVFKHAVTLISTSQAITVGRPILFMYQCHDIANISSGFLRRTRKSCSNPTRDALLVCLRK
jgi:hypothetical protein